MKKYIPLILTLAVAAAAWAADDASDVDALLEKAARLEAEGKIAEAVQLYGDVLTKYPDHPRSLNNFGAVLLRAGKYDEARQAFERAAALDPTYETPWNNLGYLYLVLQDYEKAEGPLLKAVEMNPNNESALNNLRACFIVQDRYEDAAAEWEKLAQLSPGNARIRQDLSDIYLKLENVEAAEKWARATLALDAKNVEAYLNLAFVMRATGKPEEALKVLDDASQQIPDVGALKVSLRDTLVALGRLEEARDAAEAAAALDPSPENYYALAGVLYGLKEYNEGIAACADGLAQRDDAAGYNLLGYGYSLVGRLDEAEAALAKAIARNDRYADARRNLGDVLYQKGLYAAASEQYDKAFALDAKDPWPLAMNGYCKYLSGDGVGAAAAFESVLATWPDNVKALAGLAALRREEGKIDEALDLASKAVALSPQNPDALNTLGVVYGEAGDFEKSYVYLKQLVDLGRGEVYAWANLGVAAVRTGRWEKARDAFAEAVAIDAEDLQSQSGLGLACARLKQKKAAEDALAAADALAPSYPVTLFARAILARDDGDDEKSAQFIEELLLVKQQWGTSAEKADALIKYAFESAAAL